MKPKYRKETTGLSKVNDKPDNDVASILPPSIGGNRIHSSMIA
jgi:hypothetical protein